MKDGFSLASPAGRLHARILASVAEYETEVRAERVAAGQAVARRKGKKWGGSKPGWRWKVSDDQVTAIHEMRAAGKKVAHIAGSRGCPARRSTGCCGSADARAVETTAATEVALPVSPRRRHRIHWAFRPSCISGGDEGSRALETTAFRPEITVSHSLRG